MNIASAEQIEKLRQNFPGNPEVLTIIGHFECLLAYLECLYPESQPEFDEQIRVTVRFLFERCGSSDLDRVREYLLWVLDCRFPYGHSKECAEEHTRKLKESRESKRLAITRVLSARVPLGTKFIFRTVEILGPESSGCKPPFDGQVLEVVGYDSRGVNNIVVKGQDRRINLLPVEMVEAGIRLARVPRDLSETDNT